MKKTALPIELKTLNAKAQGRKAAKKQTGFSLRPGNFPLGGFALKIPLNPEEPKRLCGALCLRAFVVKRGG